ncbi:hypothetical protein J3F84DRAFT_382638 [Trichoderma pleuroticola]
MTNASVLLNRWLLFIISAYSDYFCTLPELVEVVELTVWCHFQTPSVVADQPHTVRIPTCSNNEQKTHLVLLLRGKCNMWTMAHHVQERPRHPPFLGMI